MRCKLCLDQFLRTYTCHLLSYEGDLGFDGTPIYVETAEGRRQYQELQLQLYAQAQPIRAALIEAYDTLLSAYAAETAKT